MDAREAMTPFFKAAIIYAEDAVDAALLPAALLCILAGAWLMTKAVMQMRRFD